MSVAIVTGAAGLIGSEAVRHFAATGLDVVGIDNDMRSRFFGPDASTAWNREQLVRDVPGYRHLDVDIRDTVAVDKVFREYGSSVELIIHAAAQPSHDWAAREPITDFSVNATGTIMLLEATRTHCPGAVFIFTSTNKVYGDTPNRLAFDEQPLRYDLPQDHPQWGGIGEDMSIDQCLHSVFGASKLAADVMVQEYGRYFGMKTVAFRGGCLTGPGHSGTELHGFLAYLMKSTYIGNPYTVYGYKGKQVRDNIHARDLIRAFDCVFRAPRSGEVYNVGGGRASNCSMLEAIEMCQELAGRPLRWTYSETSRIGDHIWWISSLQRFRAHYPEWTLEYDVPGILREILDRNRARWDRAG